MSTPLVIDGPVQRLRRLRRPRAGRLRAGGRAGDVRVVTSEDPAVLDAAAACPMGAIRVVEEEGGMTRTAAVVLVAATAAVVLNVLLLGRATGANDPVGKLQPHARIPSTPAPRWTVRPAGGRGTENEGADD